MAANNASRGATVGPVSPDKNGRVGSFDAVRQIVRRRGLLGLYTGFQLHLARDTIGTGVFFGVYESTKMAITAYRGGEANSGAAISIAGAAQRIRQQRSVGPVQARFLSVKIPG